MTSGPVDQLAEAIDTVARQIGDGWDLARATGQTTAFEDSVVRQELEFTRGKLDDAPPERRPFAPPHPVAEDAPPLDQLVACLGRDPNWSPPT